MKRLIAASAVSLALLLAGCGSAPSSVTPGSKCSKSQKGMEVENPDGKEYECKKVRKGLTTTYRWVLD